MSGTAAGGETGAWRSRNAHLTPDAGDAGEPLTEAERRDLALARHGRLALTAEQITAVERIVAAREAAARAEERERALADLRGEIKALLADGPDTWEGYESRDTGHVFLADAVTDWTADLCALLPPDDAAGGA